MRVQWLPTAGRINGRAEDCDRAKLIYLYPLYEL